MWPLLSSEKLLRYGGLYLEFKQHPGTEPAAGPKPPSELHPAERLGVCSLSPQSACHHSVVPAWGLTGPGLWLLRAVHKPWLARPEVGLLGFRCQTVAQDYRGGTDLVVQTVEACGRTLSDHKF